MKLNRISEHNRRSATEEFYLTLLSPAIEHTGTRKLLMIRIFSLECFWGI